MDRVKGIVTLDVGETKNDDAITVYLQEAYLKSVAGTFSGTVHDLNEKRADRRDD